MNQKLLDYGAKRHDRIVSRLQEHLEAVQAKHPQWVGIFLQGSQNYHLDYAGSDIDSKVIVLPSFDDFALNRQPYSYTHVMENEEHVDVKDIRLMFSCFRKQNINFLEILFTKFFIINPIYQQFWDGVVQSRERIARYNNYASLHCMFGMAMEKRKALCHPYPATKDKIEKFGYDPKQLHHILRMEEFMKRWIAGVPYSRCLVTEQIGYLLSVKMGVYGKEEAIEQADMAIERMREMVDNYKAEHTLQVDEKVDSILNSTILAALKFSFMREIEG